MSLSSVALGIVCMTTLAVTGSGYQPIKTGGKKGWTFGENEEQFNINFDSKKGQNNQIRRQIPFPGVKRLEKSRTKARAGTIRPTCVYSWCSTLSWRHPVTFLEGIHFICRDHKTSDWPWGIIRLCPCLICPCSGCREIKDQFLSAVGSPVAPPTLPVRLSTILQPLRLPLSCRRICRKQHLKFWWVESWQQEKFC